MKGKNHSYTVDYFALGIMGYEFMLGRRPYKGRSRREIKEQMLSKKAHISLKEIPNGWSEDAADFFNQLLQRKPDFRLGNKGIWELKQHRWLKYYPWDRLINKELESPFIPEKKDNFDKKYCEANDTVNIETLLRYEQYKNDNEYYNYFNNFTFYRIISEITEDKNEQTSINNTLSNSSKNNEINYTKKNTNKDNEQDMDTIVINIENSERNNIIYNNKTKKENNEIKKNKTNIPNYKSNQEKISNISSKNTSKSISFTMKLIEKKEDNNKPNYNINIVKNDKIKDTINKKNPLLLRNDNPLDNSCNIKKKNKNIKKKNTCSKSPLFNEKRNIFLEKNYNGNEKNKSFSKLKRNHSSSSRFLNNRLIMSQNQYNNYQEKIRNIFSQKTKKNIIVCSPGYFSKNSLQISNNSSKMNTLMAKRNNNSELSKTPISLMSSISKSPKITTSTSNSIKRYKNKNRSVSPLIKSHGFLRHNNTAKLIQSNYINERNDNNSKIDLSNLYNKNYSYVKRIKEMNSYNYSNRIMNNNKNKNNKKSNEIVSSYSISSSNILKQIRNTNYNKNNNNKVNKTNINKNNNQVHLYKNVNVNNSQKMRQNNKISLELELNEDCQGFHKFNKINCRNENQNKSKNRNLNSNVSIKNNIINKNNSTINISSMKMAMNGNININVVIKGNNNTTN